MKSWLKRITRSARKALSKWFNAISRLLERVSIRWLGPALPILNVAIIFILEYDFSQHAQAHPNWSGLFNFLDKGFWLWVLVGGVVLSLLSALFVGLVTPTREDLRSRLAAEQGKVDTVGENIQFTVDGFVWSIAKRMGFSEKGHSRISLYLCENGSDYFSFCSRRSYNPAYERKGRAFFPVDQGSIGEAYRRGWHFDNEIPEGAEAAAHHRDRYGIKKVFPRRLPCNPF